MLTGQRTTLHTDKCTGRITRLCTSAALGGLNLTGKQVVCTVSILKCFSRFFPLPYPSMWKKHVYNIIPLYIFFIHGYIFPICMKVCLLKGNISFADSAGGRSTQTSPHYWPRPPEWKDFQERVKKVKRCSAHIDLSADVISQCHVRRAHVVATVAQGLEVGMVGKSSSPERLKCWRLLLNETCSVVVFSLPNTKETQPGWGHVVNKNKACVGVDLLASICTWKCVLMLQMSTFCSSSHPMLKSWRSFIRSCHRPSFRGVTRQRRSEDRKRTSSSSVCANQSQPRPLKQYPSAHGGETARWCAQKEQRQTNMPSPLYFQRGPCMEK